MGSATPTTVPTIAPNGVNTALPKFRNQLELSRASMPAPAARPPPAPIASPMSVFLPRCPGRFSATRRMSCRESDSWLVAALIASESSVTCCKNPRSVRPEIRVTRISDPAASWLRVDQFAIGLAGCAAATAARVAANRADGMSCRTSLFSILQSSSADRAKRRKRLCVRRMIQQGA